MMYESTPKTKIGPKVLIVDDERTKSLFYEIICKKLGYSVDVATDGEDALGKVSKSDTPYIAILCDYEMPWMNGAQFLANMREFSCLGKHRNTKVVSISAVGFPKDTNLDAIIGKQAGIDDIRKCLENLEVKDEDGSMLYADATKENPKIYGATG